MKVIHINLNSSTLPLQGASGGLLLCAGGSFTPRARQLAQLHGIVLLGRSGPVGGRPKAQGAPAAAEAPAPKPAPVLRPDHQVFVRPRFEPTVPMSDAERRRAVPQLRPTTKVAARRAIRAHRPHDRRALPALSAFRLAGKGQNG